MTEKNQRACDMLSTALDMEKKGKAYYDRAAGNCQGEQCRHIFKNLAEQEVAHDTAHDEGTHAPRVGDLADGSKKREALLRYPGGQKVVDVAFGHRLPRACAGRVLGPRGSLPRACPHALGWKLLWISFRYSRSTLV